MNLRHLFTRKATTSDIARDLARHGAAIRRQTWIEKRNAVARKLCDEASVPVPDCFR